MDRDWWCPNCKQALDGSRVTFDERCDTCGCAVHPEGVCPSCAARDAEIAKKTAECTAFFEDGVKVRAELAALREKIAMQLTAISCASLANTAESAKKTRLPLGHEYWTPALQDVCDAVDREMTLRARNEKLEKVAEVARELRDLMEDVRAGEYVPDSLTVQPIDIALRALDEKEG